MLCLGSVHSVAANFPQLTVKLSMHHSPLLFNACRSVERCSGKSLQQQKIIQSVMSDFQVILLTGTAVGRLKI